MLSCQCHHIRHICLTMLVLSCKCHQVHVCQCNHVDVVMSVSPYMSYRCDSVCVIITKHHRPTHLANKYLMTTTHHILVTMVTRSLLARHQGEWPDRGSSQGRRRLLQQQGSTGRSDRHTRLHHAAVQGDTEESAASSRTITGRCPGEDG